MNIDNQLKSKFLLFLLHFLKCSRRIFFFFATYFTLILVLVISSFYCLLQLFNHGQTLKEEIWIAPPFLFCLFIGVASLASLLHISREAYWLKISGLDEWVFHEIKSRSTLNRTHPSNKIQNLKTSSTHDPIKQMTLEEIIEEKVNQALNKAINDSEKPF